MINTIDEVIAELELIKNECRENNSPLGYFAVLYSEVTKSVKNGIAQKAFNDNKRMEKLDILFANRYIEAYKAYKNNQPLSMCWQVAFDAQTKPLLIIQHILLGINAHINLDLGIAAAETMEGKDVEGIKNDFDKINSFLSVMIDDFQERLNTASPLFGWLDKFAGNKEEKLVQFTIEKARDGAWKFTKKYHASTQKDEETIKRDGAVQIIATLITLPKNLKLKWLVKLIRLFEEKNARKVMDILEPSEG